MKDRIPANEWINNFLSGKYDPKKYDPKASFKDDVKTQIEAGWYDWFCKDSSLANKTKKMGNIIKGIKAGGKVNLKDWYIWFKNNCPLNGPLYDDFRFADLETGDVQFTVQINCCWNKHRYAVYGRTPDGEGHWDEPLFESDSLKELKDWFNTPWEI